MRSKSTLTMTTIKEMDRQGRLIVSKEMREVANCRTGDCFIVTCPCEGELHFKKTQTVRTQLQPLGQDIRALRELMERDVLVCDLDTVVAAAQYEKHVKPDTPLSEEVRGLLRVGGSYVWSESEARVAPVRGQAKLAALAVEPVLLGNEVHGAVIVLDDGREKPLDEQQRALLRYAAMLMCRHL